MELIVVNDKHELGEKAAKIVCAFVAYNPDSCLVFPTGKTPLGLYEELVDRFHASEVSFKRSFLVELDDYFGIPLEDHRNLFSWLERIFIGRVDFLPERIYRFNTAAADAGEEARRMETTVKGLGGIDLLFLGLGPNGHIGFNEPGTTSASPTRVVELTASSLQSNAEYWGKTEVVPRLGITLGMDLLLAAGRIVLLVSGRHKAKVLRQMIRGQDSGQYPASYLLQTRDLTIIADRAAASLLRKSPMPSFQTPGLIYWMHDRN
jgi:glucosamine-6-phosphate deaminase